VRDDGSQAGVEEEVRSGIGVRDDGSQAGVEEVDTPGIGGGPNNRRADFIWVFEGWKRTLWGGAYSKRGDTVLEVGILRIESHK
jgi:hypothetical protein